MKKICFLFLTSVIALSAVEWETTEVTDDLTNYDLFPLLCLDNNNHPRILFISFDEETEFCWLNLAYDTGSEWIIKEVSPLSTWLMYFLDSPVNIYSLDIDSKGNTWVAFVDVDDINEVFQLCMACDTGTGGSFVVDTLTRDEMFQLQVLLQLDCQDQPKLTYLETDIDFENAFLHYGWLDEGELASDPITEISYDYEPWPLDMVLDEADLPHVFYTDFDEEYYPYIHHAFTSSQYAATWDSELVLDSFAVLPSAALDASGDISVAYCTGEDIEKIGLSRMKSGSWEKELVFETDEFEEIFQIPCLAFNPAGTPYIARMEYDTSWNYELWLYYKYSEGWNREQITSDPENWEVPGIGHFFRVDDDGYGHLAYTSYNEYHEIYDICYARSLEPLPSSGISENSPAITQTNLDIRGHSVLLDLLEPARIHIDLYDASGRYVSSLASGSFEAGTHSLPINTSGLASGVYFVRAEIGEQYASAKYMLVR